METEIINAELQEADQEVWVDAQRNDGTWKPEKPGDFLTGYYENFEQTQTGKNLYSILQQDNEIIKIWGGKIIDSFFNHKTGVQIGEKVKITFVGKVMIEGKFNAQGEPAYYNDFKVQHTLGKRAASQLPKEESVDQEKIEEMFPEDKPIDVKKIPF
jgi:hypothetical protein